MKRILFLAITISLLIYGCVEPPDYPVEPVIEYISITKTEVIAQTTPPDANRNVDSFYITFGFTDGDGDLGIEDGSTEQNVLVSDPRTGTVEERYQILKKDIPTGGIANGISGEITIKIPNTFCFRGSASRDTTHLTIQVFDRARNYSNIIRTPDIILICD